ncbi:MAG: family 78 glycoside hydrolase catalytic domain [Lentisphaeria bacterium]|nr:family 78 glycoside hydrolase catalytic domain [Lentisphaeria bacterium]
MKMFVEYTERPLAVGIANPRFSWEVPLAGRNRKQSAYRILVGTGEELLKTGRTDLWDSGKVDSSQSVNVEYRGARLSSDTDYFWSVQVWDEGGNAHGFSLVEPFGTALLNASDWKADWIGMGPAAEPMFDPYSIHQDDATSGGLRLAERDYQKMGADPRDHTPEPRAPHMRKAFSLDKPVKRARAFICGLGLFELRLNGAKVGDDVLATPRTDFRKRVYYFTYDITGQLAKGENVVGVILGNGWFNAQKKHWHWQAPWFGEPRALVQLDIDFEDGSRKRVISDESWRGDGSPLVFNCLYDGEDYDARLEQPGWDTPGFDACQWRPVTLVPAPGGRLTAMDHQANKVMKRFKPASVSEPEPGVFVFDMGTVMTGWVAVRIPQGAAGQTVTLRYAELLHKNGMINPGTAGGARQSDLYTMKGGANEFYEPRFTYHGFRYVEVTGCPGQPNLSTLEACFVHQGVEPAGSFECGHALINKIHACTLQSQRCNLQMGVPTDDTQREERLGWCGDAWSYAEECFYNLDSARFWSKWIADFYDQQDPDSGLAGYICPLPGWGEDLIWSAAFVLIPWWHYLHYGDRRLLSTSYPYLKKYVAYLEKTGKKELPDFADGQPGDLLFPKCELKDRYSTPENHGYLQHSLFGDHLATHEGGSGMGKDQPRSMATAFYHHDVTTMIQIAETLGEVRDAEEYRGLAAKIKSAFNDRFFDTYGGYYDGGCQSAQALALAFDLVPEERRGRVISYLNSSVNFRQRRITSGYAGTKWVVHAIGLSGRDDILWKRATATDYPSWGYMLRGNKTTICENWAGKASQCHTTLGAAIDEWFFRGLAGIRPDTAAPGFEKIIFKPYLPKDLPWVKASLRTVRGMIVSEWEQDGAQAELVILVPANSTAKVYIPVPDSGAIFESGLPAGDAEGVEVCEITNGGTVFLVGSGRYRFRFPVETDFCAEFDGS